MLVDRPGQHSKQGIPGQDRGPQGLDLARWLEQLPAKLEEALELAQTLSKRVAQSRQPVELVRNRHLTQDQIDTLCDDFRAGASIAELARRHQLHRSTITHHLQEAGLKQPGRQYKLTDTQIQQAIQLYDSGLSLADVGHRLGVDAATIRNTFTRIKHPVRPRKGWDT